jgi:uncharacterized protein YbjT (DUF2867 family)
MILVTGSGGAVGRELLKELTAMGARVRAGYHTRPPSLPQVEGVRLDVTTGDGLDAALAGVASVFLLSGDLADQTGGELRVVEAARRAGVRHLVKLSVFGAESEAFSFAKIHRPVERAIEGSGIPYTFLRPNSFMQNFVNYYGDTIRTQSAFYLSCGDARVSHVDVRDIARVAALVLTTDGHAGSAYDLCGPEALTHAEAASKLSIAMGRPINYVDLPEADLKQGLMAAGTPEWYADALVDLYRYYTTGQAGGVTTAIKDVTGRDPISFDQFARDYAALWTA